MRRSLRRLHLYLGCIFAPLLLFFTVSGFFQTFLLHVDQKDGYAAPRLLKEISEVHLYQRLGELDSERPASSVSFRYAVALMSLGLVATIFLGVFMAFHTLRRPGRILLCLFTGTLLPVLLLLLGPHERAEPPNKALQLTGPEHAPIEP